MSRYIDVIERAFYLSHYNENKATISTLDINIYSSVMVECLN